MERSGLMSIYLIAFISTTFLKKILNLLCIHITILIFPIFIALFISVTCTVPNFRFIIIFFLNHVSTVLLSVGILCVSLSVCVFCQLALRWSNPASSKTRLLTLLPSCLLHDSLSVIFIYLFFFFYYRKVHSLLTFSRF